MDDSNKRMREMADNCIKAYEEWRKDEKDSDKREQLQDAIHELRKVAARFEIEIAISEKSDRAERPIPIPSHRAARNKGDNGTGNNNGNDNLNSGGGSDNNQGNGSKSPAPRKRYSGRKTSSSSSHE